ncbi:MAG: right-handed parallel beta-helix repeat-containing protein, partial [Pirellulales bacterium]
MFQAGSDGVRSSRSFASLGGFGPLEARAMLAADDIVVSLVANQLVLTLDSAGTAITDLSTTFASKTRVLSITAASAGTLSLAAPITGVTIDPATDTISVDLKTLKTFAGISVVGSTGTDRVVIGKAGVNLAAVTKGAAAQSLSIDTGTGASDAIVIASPVSAKGAGSVSLASQGQAIDFGIILQANVTSPAGSQTFGGAVSLESRGISVTAGQVITFASTVDGDQRLTVSAGGPVAFLGAIGGNEPLSGVTLARAAGVAFADGFELDGTGTAAGTSGLVINSNVNSVVFLPSGPLTREITGFSGAGIQFVGGSRNSLVTSVSSIGNGVGLQAGPGIYTGTAITGSTFTANTGNGVTLTGAQQISLGGSAAGAGNVITFNNRFGVGASGASAGSVIRNNQISNNLLGNVGNLLLRNATPVVATAQGLTVIADTVGLAALRAVQVGRYAFDVSIDANGVLMSSQGALDFARQLVTSTVEIQPDASAAVQRTQFRQTGGFTFVDGRSLGTTGLPWVRMSSSPQATQPAVRVTNAILTDLTPRHVLRSLEFPVGTQFVGADSFGQRYQTNMGLSTFVALLPLYNLAGVR